MKNFKVVFTFKTNCILQDDLYLDALISTAKAKEILKDNFYLGNNAGDINLIRQTLDKIIDRNYDVYMCSKLFIDDQEEVGFYTKRYEQKYEDLLNQKSKVDTLRGFTKNYHNGYRYKTGLTAYAYCCGDKNEIERLLNKNLFYIGKKRSQGFGEISNIQFEEIDEFPWIVDNRPSRNVPEKYKNDFICDYNTASIPLISPYWREEREICIY